MTGSQQMFGTTICRCSHPCGKPARCRVPFRNGAVEAPVCQAVAALSPEEYPSRTASVSDAWAKTCPSNGSSQPRNPGTRPRGV